MKHIISLGAGVQSSTMALMAAHGEITPMPDCAIFADTQAEPQDVYTWLDWLEKQLPFPVYRVTAGNLRDAALRMRKSGKSGNTYLAIGLPVYVVDENGKKGMGMRQCTRTFKIDPIRREMRRIRDGASIVQWIGISFDELIRMKPSRDKWCENRWPLVDLRMTRRDCLAWMDAHGYPQPPRSACTFCPYHSDREWMRLREENPSAFEDAVAFEGRLQLSYDLATALRSVPFLHSSRIPLISVSFDKEASGNLFGNECEGMCGV